ncbi:MAG: cysteine--tRNA ligase [Candidatus Nanohaloarchaeota archaeon]|nr:cysteine--tRNA ligase [Candidatus Nanohaloarchaeota archaeon]
MKIYNTLSQKIEEFLPQKSKEVKMYVCGITPYDEAHIGHARTAVFFDVVHRFFLFKGYDVKYVRNITDVDDKIIKKAIKENKTYKEIAEHYMRSYKKHLKRLNVLDPWKEPKVSDHIRQIDKLIQILKEKGIAYEISDGIYFHVPLFKEYGKLSHQNLEELNKHRIEPNPEKKDVKDFALWKFPKKDDELAGTVFESNCCGLGRPGWHIECSAMSMHYLGETLDIHGGGKDLIFPHHENEIAQSESATGKPFAKYWMHVHFVNIKGEKMSKSLKNFVALKDALKAYTPLQLRIFLLSAHYRKDIDYNEKALEDAKAKEIRILNFLKRLSYELWFIDSHDADVLEGDKLLKEKIYFDEFLETLENDFHTEKAFMVLFEQIDAFHKTMELLDKNLKSFEKQSYISYIKNIHDFWKKANYILGLQPFELQPLNLDNNVYKKMKLREKLRKEKKYDEADKIRKEFEEMGYVLMDAPYRTIIVRENYGN